MYVLSIVVCTFSFGHCVVCSSSIYGLWLPLWYLQTLLRYNIYIHVKQVMLLGVNIKIDIITLNQHVNI